MEKGIGWILSLVLAGFFLTTSGVAITPTGVEADVQAVQQYVMEANCVGSARLSLASDIQVRFRLSSSPGGIEVNAMAEIGNPLLGPRVLFADETRLHEPKAGFATAFFGGPPIQLDFGCTPNAADTGTSHAELSVRQITEALNTAIAVSHSGHDRLDAFVDLKKSVGQDPYPLYRNGVIDPAGARVSFGAGTKNPYWMAISRNVSATAGPDEPLVVEFNTTVE